MLGGARRVRGGDDHGAVGEGKGLEEVTENSGLDQTTRFVVVGVISGKHWSAVITYRDDRVRLISVRRARVEEVAIYES